MIVSLLIVLDVTAAKMADNIKTKDEGDDDDDDDLSTVSDLPAPAVLLTTTLRRKQ